MKATAQGTEKATVKGNLRAGARAPGSRGPTVNEALAAPPRKVGRTEPPNFKEGAVKAEILKETSAMTRLRISEAVDPLKSEMHEVNTELQEYK